MPERNYSHDPHIPPVPQPKLVTAPPKPKPAPEGDDDIPDVAEQPLRSPDGIQLSAPGIPGRGLDL